MLLLWTFRGFMAVICIYEVNVAWLYEASVLGILDSLYILQVFMEIALSLKFKSNFTSYKQMLYDVYIFFFLL